MSAVATPSGFLTIGQPVAERLARRMLAEPISPGTILVHGPAGTGKGIFVDDLLATAFCEKASGDDRPCNACPGCAAARARTHPDLVIASPETWREERGGGESIVAAARRWLADVAGAPIRGRWRVIVIESAGGANEQVQNALLKVLEEPGDRHLFVLVADDPRRLLPTIRSRARALRVGPVSRADLAGWLVERGLPDEQASVLARLADGRIGTALDLADHPSAIEWRRTTQHELLALLERGRADRMAAVHELIEDTRRTLPLDRAESEPADPSAKTPTVVQRAASLAIVDAWISLARDLALASAGSGGLAVSAELVPDLERMAGRLPPRAWADATLDLERIRGGLEENVSPRLGLEAAMLSWPALAAR